MRRSLVAVCLLGLLVFTSVAQEEDASEPEQQPPPRASRRAGALSVDKVTAVVLSADGKKLSTSSGGPGELLLRGTKLGPGQSVEVSFTPLIDGAAAKPQQAMLLAGVAGGSGGSSSPMAAYAIAKVKKDGGHAATLSSASIDKQIAHVGGELSLSLLLGDPSVPVGLRLELGSLELPEAAAGGDPKPRLLSASHQPMSNAKPTIAHTFRPPAKRAPAVVSLAFTALAFVPLAGLVVALGALGVNLKGLPAGAANLWVLLFHGGIAAMLGLYLLFWLRLNLAQTVPLALALGTFTAGTGYKALSALSAERLAADGKGALAAKKTN